MARKALLGRTNGLLGCWAVAAAAAAGRVASTHARPGLTILTTFSPVFFFSRVIKSRVSVRGARVGRGASRGVSRCEARTSGALNARFPALPSPSQLMIGMPCN
jgi:hypothetical protein